MCQKRLGGDRVTTVLREERTFCRLSDTRRKWAGAEGVGRLGPQARVR